MELPSLKLNQQRPNKLSSDEAESTAAAVPLGSVSPRPERKAMRAAAAEFAERGRSASQQASQRLSFDQESPDGDLSSSSTRDIAASAAQWPPFREAVLRSQHSHDGPGVGRVNCLTTSRCGQFTIFGDSNGKLAVLRNANNRGSVHDDDPGAGSGNDRRKGLAFHTGTTSYSAVIDPLKSVEITPTITSVAAMPTNTPALFILCANEKTPKLYKVVELRDSPAAFSAIDQLGSRRVGPLTVAGSETPTTLLHATFALDHEYRVHSVCPTHDGRHFFSVDDLEVKQWAVESPEIPLDVFSMRPPGEEAPTDRLTSAAMFNDIEPTLLFLSTFSGEVRMWDTRSSLKWGDQHSQCMTFVSESLDPENVPAAITTSALSPCGRYIAARDGTSVTVWDARKGNGSLAKVGQRQVHGFDPHLLDGRNVSMSFASIGGQPTIVTSGGGARTALLGLHTIADTSTDVVGFEVVLGEGVPLPATVADTQAMPPEGAVLVTPNPAAPRELIVATDKLVHDVVI